MVLSIFQNIVSLISKFLVLYFPVIRLTLRATPPILGAIQIYSKGEYLPDDGLERQQRLKEGHNILS